jgi:hypothetical protein
VRSFVHSSLISSSIRTLFAGRSGDGMLAQNSCALMFEFTFQVRWEGCMSESSTTWVVRVGGGFSIVPVVGVGIIGVIGVVGVVGVEAFMMEFWLSLCKEPLLLCSLLGGIIAVSIRLSIWCVVEVFSKTLRCTVLIALSSGVSRQRERL